MGGKLRGRDDCAVERVDRCQPALPEAHVQPLAQCVIPDVVRVTPDPDRPSAPKVIGPEQLESFTLSIRDGDDMSVRHHRDSLRLAKRREAFDVDAGLKVQHLHCVVAKRGHKQPPTVGGQMIDAAFDLRHSDGLYERNRRLLRCRLAKG
jgi:hypothetical protein